MLIINKLFALTLAASFCFSCSGNSLPDDETGERMVVKKKKPGDPNASPNTNPNPNVGTPTPADPEGPIPVGDDGLPLTRPGHVPVIDPNFPGLDTALVPKRAPVGCLNGGGFESENKQLSLTLDEETPGVRLHVDGEQLFANEDGCTLKDGSPLLVSMLRRIATLGGAENNVLILDMAGGSFGSELFVNEGAFYGDLGAGADQLLVRGSHENDDLYVGSGSQRLMLALTSMARINVWLKATEFLTVSLGPGDDGLLPIQRLNVGLYDVDTGGSLHVKDLSVPLRVWGGDGADAINGSALDDYLSGGPGADELNGLGGNDFFDEGVDHSGADVLNGGEGLDEVSYRWRSQNLVVSLCQTVAAEDCPPKDCECTGGSGEEGEGDNVVNFEIVRAGSGDDVISGSAGDDYVYAEDGNDVLKGNGGSDVLQGGVGTDDFGGGEGGDICDNDPGEPMTGCEI